MNDRIPPPDGKYKRPLVTCGQCGWKMRFDVLVPHTKLRHPGEFEFFVTKIPPVFGPRKRK